MIQRELLLIASTIFLTVMSWVLFEVYTIKKNTPTEQMIQSIDINYTINVEVLEALKQKKPSYVQ